jgi:pimeloyl-ACP methyl ester carboxylesterase
MDSSVKPFPEIAWMESYRDRVNADAEMQVIGGWFTTSLSFAFGERRYVVRMERGKIADINAAPRIDARCAMTEAVAASIPGCRMTIMKGMGHFPMVENYAAFRPFLLPELALMAQG